MEPAGLQEPPAQTPAKTAGEGPAMAGCMCHSFAWVISIALSAFETWVSVIVRIVFCKGGWRTDIEEMQPH